MTNFSDILAKSAAEIKELALLPVGTYFGTVKSVTTGESSAKKTPYIRVTMTVDGIDADVDEEALEEAGGLVTDKGPREIRRDHYFIADQETFGVSLKRVLESAGVVDKSYAEIINDGLLNGRSVRIGYVHELYTGNDGEQRQRGLVNSIVFIKEAA